MKMQKRTTSVNQYDRTKLKSYGCYHDDCIGKLRPSKNNLILFITSVNFFHPALKYTCNGVATSVHYKSRLVLISYIHLFTRHMRKTIQICVLNFLFLIPNAHDHLCPGSNSDAKFTFFCYGLAKITNLTIFRDSLAKIAKFTNLTIFRLSLLRILQNFQEGFHATHLCFGVLEIVTRS